MSRVENKLHLVRSAFAGFHVAEISGFTACDYADHALSELHLVIVWDPTITRPAKGAFIEP